MDPQSKQLVVVEVGGRTLAQRVVHQVIEVLAPGCVPLFLIDGLKDYATALLTHFGQWMQPERRQPTGPMPKPRWKPLPALLYAQKAQVRDPRRRIGFRANSSCDWQPRMRLKLKPVSSKPWPLPAASRLNPGSCGRP